MRKAFAVVLLLLCVGCARRAPLTSDGSTVPAIGSTPQPAASTPSSVSGTKHASASRSDSPEVAASKAAARIPPEERLPLTVTMSATCLTRGDTMKVIAKTTPGAQVAFTAYYTTNNNYTPDIFYVPKEANVDGTVPWTFALRPDTPLGPAQLIVLASKSPKKGYFQGEFTVAETCRDA